VCSRFGLDASRRRASAILEHAQLGLMRRLAVLVLIGQGAFAVAHANSSLPTSAEMGDIERRARGTAVYFNAWAGDEAINRYIAWAGAEISRRYGVTLVHVKVADVAEAVTRILSERVAGRLRGGSVDLLWLNGENFAALRNADLLYGPWADRVPNARLIDTRGNPTTVVDFTVPTGGYELAWGSARFTLFYDSAAVAVLPRDPGSLLAWIRAHPGRFTYPRPPNFLGTSFLEQLLLLLVSDTGRLQRPVGRDFAAVTRPLWAWLDAAQPSMWRRGHLFPPSGPAQRELLAVGEVDWAVAFNPLEGRRAIARHELPDTVRAMGFSGGALTNSHFLAIPANANNPDGAMLVANFLLSAHAQAVKADVFVWGDPTVLDLNALLPSQRRWFDERSFKEQSADEQWAASRRPPAPIVSEPHPSWSVALERDWIARYGVQ
jgi:putative thiamine transport system substrate-binding protein